MNMVVRFRSVRRRLLSEKVRCNICDKCFRADSRFERFCRSCKLSDELYRFSGWFRGGANA